MKNNIYSEIKGNGGLTVAINGGPGMSHNYFRRSFSPLEDFLEMVYFDQPGCGKSISCTPTEQLTISSFADLINSLPQDREYNLIVHSWGTYILGRALSLGLLNHVPKKILFLNPAPFTKTGIDKVFNKLLDRIPTVVLDNIEKLRLTGTIESGKKIMEMALPYYTGSVEIPNIDVDYNINTGTIIGNEITDYNFNDIFSELLDDSIYVFGERDYITMSDMEILTPNNNITELKCGKFGFAENNEEFINIAREFFVEKY